MEIKLLCHFSMIFKYILHASRGKLGPLPLIFQFSVTEYQLNVNGAQAGSILNMGSESGEKPSTKCRQVSLDQVRWTSLRKGH